MIDIIIAHNGNTEDLKTTLSSLGYMCNQNIVIAHNEKIGVNDLNMIVPKAAIHFCVSDKDSALSKFAAALNTPKSSAEYVTFLKSGDTVCLPIHLEEIESLFGTSPTVNIVEGRVVSSNRALTNNGKELKIQGKVFRRHWLDRLNIFNSFVNDCEFALYFSHMCEATSNICLELPYDMVRTEDDIIGWGEAYVHFLMHLFPKTNYYNKELAEKYLAQGICDFYFVFLSTLNLEGQEEELNKVLEETKLFYLYFQEQEMSNLNILLTVYNGAILKHYSIYDDAAIMKIPCLNLVSFLDELEAMVSSN